LTIIYIFRSLQKNIMARGKPPAPAIPMTNGQVQILEQLTKGHKRAQQISKRAQLLLLAHQGQSNSAIKRSLGLALNTVKSWRKRWLDVYEELLNYESCSELAQAIETLLNVLPRSGAPETISLAAKQQIIALACEEPSHYGLHMNSWTHEMLAKVAIAQGIISTISGRHVGRILKNQPPSTS